MIARSRPTAPFTIPVLMICYYPLRGDRINRDITGDVDGRLVDIRNHVTRTTAHLIGALEAGSSYHAYLNPQAVPSLRYRIVHTVEVFEPLPIGAKAGHRVPMTDYNAILARFDVRSWVEQSGVKEIWIWGYHGGVLDLWESNMAGPYGDISNSDRDLFDLPPAAKTYTVYHYNYQRGVSEATENHMHQIEALLRHVDAHLFWDKFVGRPGEGRCGWSHYPPNAQQDYDWANPRYVETDIEDWRPDGGGRRLRLNCERWGRDSLTWFIYWMQNLPGADNGLIYRERRLTNWWTFVGDFDGAMAANMGLTE